MVRARLARVALVAALGLASGCSSMSPCSGNCSLMSRLTGFFRHDRSSTEVVGTPIEGPVIADPGSFEAPPTFGLPPQSAPPPLFPAPRPTITNEAQRMPYQP